MDIAYLAKLLTKLEESKDKDEYVKVHMDVLRPLMARLIKEAADV